MDGRAVAAPRPEQRSITGLRELDLHMERRKLWNRGFNSAALKDYEIIVIRRGKQLIEALEARKGAVDISTWLGYFTCVAALGNFLLVSLKLSAGIGLISWEIWRLVEALS